MKKTAFAVAAWLAVACSVAVAQEAEGLKQVMEKVYPGLVRIQVIMKQPNLGRTARGMGAGSGFVISEDGYICTNHHVVGNAEKIVCRMSDGEEIPATLIGTDPALDVAVIKLDLAARQGTAKIKPCVWGDSSTLTFGSPIFVCGSPAGMTQTIAEGKVTNPFAMPWQTGIGDNWKRNALDGEELGGIARWIGHDANCQGGNSGGPLANEKGEVIGVMQVSTGQLHGAIPAADAIPVVEQILKYGEVRRSFTGLILQPRLRADAAQKGVLVSGVLEDSPASKAGIKPGDLIQSWDGQPLDAASPEDMILARITIFNTEIGKDVPVKLLRDGKELVVTLKTVLRERTLGESAELNSWGVTGRNISDSMARQRHLQSRKGVLVDTVRPGGPSNNGQPPLKHGDVITKVNGRTVVDLADLRRLSREIAKGKEGEEVEVLVSVNRGKEEVLTVLNIGREPEEIIPELTHYATLDIATQVFNADLGRLMGLEGVEGVRITRVKEGGAGEKAGLKVGDIIYQFGKRAIPASRNKDAGVFEQMVRESEVGSTVELGVYRGTEKLELVAQLVDEPISADKMLHFEDKMFEFSARDLTVDDRDNMNLDADQKGALIRDVEPAGWAYLAKLAIGDILLSVNGQPVDDIKSLKKVMADVREKKSERIIFFVKRGIGSHFLEVQPSWVVDEDEVEAEPGK